MIAPGICRHCGCREGERCRMHDGDECCFIDRTRTVCSSPQCVRAETVRKQSAAKEAKPKYSGWGYGAIVQDKRRQDRLRRKKDAQAR